MHKDATIKPSYEALFAWICSALDADWKAGAILLTHGTEFYLYPNECVFTFWHLSERLITETVRYKQHEMI